MQSVKIPYDQISENPNSGKSLRYFLQKFRKDDKNKQFGVVSANFYRKKEFNILWNRCIESGCVIDV